MTSLSDAKRLGVDVSMRHLDICDGRKVTRIDNDSDAITTFFKRRRSTFTLAVEPTNRYHKLFVDHAVSYGHTVFLVDPYKVSKYREALGVRAKTDASDAELLYRYLSSEVKHLIPYRPVNKEIDTLIQLLRARGTLVKERTRIKQSLSNVPALSQELTKIVEAINQSIKQIDERLKDQVNAASLSKDYQRCLSIPGVGPVIAAAFVALYHRCDFKKADSFIAFMGMDVRVKESGLYRGKRKLSKRGDPEVRRLLFNGARAGARTSQWHDNYLSLRERGLSTTAAHVALGRKLARVAYALMRDKMDFIPAK